jgi:hypothetical protein
MRRAEMEQMQRQLIADAILNADADDMLEPINPGTVKARAPRSAAGDSARLRGVPMIGGVSGHIPGTRPGSLDHLDRMEREARPE